MTKPDLKVAGKSKGQNPTQELTQEEMKALIQADKIAREQRAISEIQKILLREKCVMEPVTTINTRGVFTKVDIIALD
jgi:hypothetical protein